METENGGANPQLYYNTVLIDDRYIFCLTTEEISSVEITNSLGKENEGNIIGKPSVTLKMSDDRLTAATFVTDVLTYLTKYIIPKFNKECIDKKFMCEKLGHIIPEDPNLKKLESDEKFNELIESYVIKNKLKTNSSEYLAYLASATICYIYTGKLPEEIWNDLETREKSRNVDITKNYMNGVRERITNDLSIKLISKKYDDIMSSLVEKIIWSDNASPLVETGMPTRMAEFISRILIYTGETFSIKSMWENCRIPIERLDVEFIEPSKNKCSTKIRINAGSSYTGIKHITAESPCEDCCGSGSVAISKFNKGNKISVGAYYIFVSDGVSGSSIKIDEINTTTPAVGSYCSRYAIESVSRDICELPSNGIDLYRDIKKYMEGKFAANFFKYWVDAIKEKMGVEINPMDYTATFSGTIVCRGWTIFVKIGNGTFVVSQGKTEKSYYCVYDNCVHDVITGSIGKSLERPDYWNYMIVPSDSVYSVLMSSDGADTILNNKKIPFNDICVNCTNIEMPQYAKLIHSLDTMEEKDIPSTIDKLVKDTSVGARYLGDSTNNDDITIAYVSFLKE